MDFDAAIATAQNAQQFNASEIARQHDPQQMLRQNMARSMYAVGDAAERLGASRQAQLKAGKLDLSKEKAAMREFLRNLYERTRQLPLPRQGLELLPIALVWRRPRHTRKATA